MRQCVSGEKAYVTNANNSNVFIVLAQTSTPDHIGDLKDTLTAFIVESSMPGVQINTRENTIGCAGVPQASITFNKVELGTGTSFAQNYQRQPSINIFFLFRKYYWYCWQWYRSCTEATSTIKIKVGHN